MSLPSLAHSLPSNSSILLSLLASIVLLSTVRVVFLHLGNYIGSRPQKQVQAQAEGNAADSPEGSRQHRSSWPWRQLSWDSLPSLPVSLAVPGNESHGKGVGMQEKRPPQPWQTVRGRRGGPMFETPLPALYQSKEPLSMAKMIMSRHTYRRPSSRPPARPMSPPTRTAVPPASSPSLPSLPSSASTTPASPSIIV
ncbi:hypothetical protein C0995_008836 [Termitomyces sp. Mi166|nr:hypothetical protein C0995_008836 [Termitomyces sp. Mi166\